MKKIKIPEKIKEKLKKLNVGIIYLYGSQATDTTHPMSDFDVGVVFTDSNFFKKQDSLELHCQLYDIFSDILPLTMKNDVDIGYLQKSSPMLQMEAIKQGKIIFEQNPILRADYEEKVISKYLDYKPYYEEYYNATMEALKGI